jgi:hypothetical protein
MGEAVDIAIAITIGFVIIAAGWWVIRFLAAPVAGEPDPEDVVEVSIDYRCSVCGLQLTITHAREDDIRPPRHCREEMEPR